jgi:hypothetical protein
MPLAPAPISPQSIATAASKWALRALLAALVVVVVAVTQAPGDDKKPEPRPDETPRIGRKAPPPRTERVVIGTYKPGDRLPSVLVSRPPQPADAPFKRVALDGEVYSTDTLVSLPGFTSRVETKSGVALTMRGNLPEFSVNPLMDFLLEAEVVLHAPPQAIDLDLTLERGRVHLANTKDNKSAVVRLRFLDQAWDLTLSDGAEVGVDLIKKYPPEINYHNEEPWTVVALFVLEGKVDFTSGLVKQKLEAAPGRALVQWDSHGADTPIATAVPEASLVWSRQSPAAVLARHINLLNVLKEKAKPEDAQRIQFEIEFYTAQSKRTKDALASLNEIGALLSDRQRPDVTLADQRQSKQPVQRHVALFALAALGDLATLTDTLAETDPDRSSERDDAVFLLRRVASRGLESSRRLYHEDGKKRTGVLVEKFGERDGDRVFALLHDFDAKSLTPDTFQLLTTYLKNDKLALRQLAHWHLLRLSVGVTLPREAADYNPADPSRPRRDAGADQWAKLVADKKLPPRP